MRWIPIGMALLCPVTAVAQETASFRSRVGAGMVTGTESFTITTSASGHQIAADIRMKRGAADASFVLSETLAPSWSPESYRIEMTGGLGTATVTAERRGEVLSLSVKTPAGTPEREFPAPQNLILMDNMLAAPYQVLLNLTGGKPGTVSVIVPFQLAAIPGTLEAAGTAAGTLDGKPVVTTRLLLKVSTVTAEVYADTATNRLLRVFVPAQDAELVREGFVPAATSSPAPLVRPTGVTERDVTFKTLDGAPYPAVLCAPANAAPVPIVVLVHGSGPQDRDETIGPNKPFRDLAWGLAERGVATLRYDKRTFSFPKAYTGTLESEAIDDAADAAAFARTIEGVDASRVFVLGHSLGGLAVMYVVQRVPVRGLILMAAPGRPMDQVIRDQVRTLNASLGEAKLAETLKLQDDIMARIRAGTATDKDVPGQPVGAIRDMIVRDPIAELKKTSVPMLVLKGGKDAQVFQPDFDALQALAASRPGSDSRLFPDLTHIFTPTSGAAEFRAIFEPGRLSPHVIETIAAWVRKTER